MENKLLEIKNLNIVYRSEDGVTRAVKDLNLSIDHGESLGIIGESGSGKTSLGLSIMGLLSRNASVEGEIIYKGKDLLLLNRQEMKSINWTEIAMIFQNSLDIFNPVLKIGEQIGESMIEHGGLSKKEALERSEELLEMVGLEPKIVDYYPHQLSGGMRQRVLVAMALACEADILIADELTSALDAYSKKEIIELIKNLQEELGFALIIISHEMETILKLSDQLMVMYLGNVLETGRTKEVLRNPFHSYTRGLVNSSPSINIYKDMWGIPRSNRSLKKDGCSFYDRCDQALTTCNARRPSLEEVADGRQVSCNRGGIVTLLEGIDISKTYRMDHDSVRACRSCNINLKSGELLSLVGESGSGKSTLAGILSGLNPPDKGKVLYQGKAISGNEATRIEGGIQIVFQDPFSSTNEQFSIFKIVTEPLAITKLVDKDEMKIRAREVLEAVELPSDEEFLRRKCFSLSGGQRQRLALARSLIMRPRILIADEISAMLDPSTQANILRLLKKLQNDRGFAMIYITHDLNLSLKISDTIYVMKDGEIVESGNAIEVIKMPKTEYTKKLISNLNSYEDMFC